MKHTIVLSTLFLFFMGGVSQSNEDAASFFHKDRNYWSQGKKAPNEEAYGWESPPSVPANRTAVSKMVASSAESRLGGQWVNTALKLAKLESGFNCAAVGPKTRHGRARGVLQVIPASAKALGYNPSRLNECKHGIDAGIAHMQSCLDAGVRTHEQMARCHVAGVGGWNKRLSRSAERYKRAYVRMASR
jgi:hypothetical protein